MKWGRLFLGILCVFFLNCKSAKPDHSMIIYVDQNNNRYEISKEAIRYVPIQPLESSSGLYSGGQKKTVVIDKATFRNLFAFSEELYNYEGDNVVKRDKRTSVLYYVVDGKKTSEKIIRPPNEVRVKLETLLRSIVE